MTSQPPPPLGLPAGLNPDALDTLSDLASVLTRLRGTGGGTSSTSTQNHTAGPSSTTSTITGATTSGSTTTTAAGGPPLALKDLPGQSDQLRHRFQKARALVRTLPDMERSTAEQEVEIAALEAKIARQKETLEKLKALGNKFAATSRDDGDGDRMEE
ncbi:RNA polymerase II transcription mediator complex subunit 9-domain-containing protein [Microdochium trichocladiopsis]|uniref:Mediator of RNA polymerase II transcription subunit 9 n=1 Tax=Microdochium trichocladiopsis TaxID=1682393 RepID=A0A9P8Y2C2_9PEZI|nr:RNA polymerase II transcription mediator complex subunit 9-domain-containing protein [Microdochium trichocladiopsis]KAH7029159.1 RNA polymerase II transcription mediator complex subunit 9-domain-containing protein [Microdochium trichocladiopsis]